MKFLGPKVKEEIALCANPTDWWTDGWKSGQAKLFTMFLRNINVSIARIIFLLKTCDKCDCIVKTKQFCAFTREIYDTWKVGIDHKSLKNVRHQCLDSDLWRMWSYNFLCDCHFSRGEVAALNTLPILYFWQLIFRHFLEILKLLL